MKYAFIITCVAAAVTFSCNTGNKKKAPPPVLEGKKIDVSSIYKSRGNDLVDALYEELVSQSAELRDLEDQIADLKKQWPDSMSNFKKFNEKNSIYYTAAGSKTSFINDSVLRKKMLTLIKDSHQQYRDSTAVFITLDSLLQKRTATLSDLYIALKLVKTLPVIEEWQKNNLPDSTPAGHALHNLDSMAKRLDTLVNWQ